MTLSKVKPQLPPPATSVPFTDASPAANDGSAPTVSNDLRNPMWIIAMGMAWFFGITAAVMALS